MRRTPKALWSYSLSPGPAKRAFTIVELMLVLLILSIISALSFDAISSFEANQRADRAARESLACFRAARTLALTTGKNAKVTVNTAANTLSVFWMSNGTAWDATPALTGLTSSGKWVINLNSIHELQGTSVLLSPATTTDFIYNSMGTCAQTGTVTFAYAGRSKSLVVVNVGDPQFQ